MGGGVHKRKKSSDNSKAIMWNSTHNQWNNFGNESRFGVLMSENEGMEEQDNNKKSSTPFVNSHIPIS